MLIPITLDLEVQTDNQPGMRLKDRFLWNVNEPFLTPRRFAEMLCSDLAIGNSYIETISDLVANQIEEAQAVAEIDIVDQYSDAVFTDKEVQVDEDEEEVWTEADQRIIVNVSLSRTR
jgi:chromatin structure-remodeling complex subunit SFH1